MISKIYKIHPAHLENPAILYAKSNETGLQDFQDVQDESCKS